MKIVNLEGNKEGNFPVISTYEDYIHKCNLTWIDAATIRIGVGRCIDSTNSEILINTSNIDIDITDSGANGLDTGSEAASTWYYIFRISGTSGEAGLFSESFDNPTLPAGYTKFRRVGCWYNDASSNANSIKSEVVSRRMPQGSSLTNEEIQAIRCWVDEGALNN